MRRLTLSVVTLGGCQLSAPLTQGFEDDLTETGGCADLIAYAVNSDDTVLLHVLLDGPLEASGGQAVTTEVELPDPFALVTVDIGKSVSDATCDDLIINGGPKVRETWTAIGGTVSVNVHPEETPGEGPRADVHIDDVLLESPHGDQVTIDVFDWISLSVGWFPG